MSRKVIGAEYVENCAYRFCITPSTIAFIEKWDHKTWENYYDLRLRIYWSDDTITYLSIPAKTKTDGSRVPFPLNAFIPAVSPNFYAALPHDLIYRDRTIQITCGQADDIYYFLAYQKKWLAHAGLRTWNFIFKTNPNYMERACK